MITEFTIKTAIEFLDGDVGEPLEEMLKLCKCVDETNVSADLLLSNNPKLTRKQLAEYVEKMSYTVVLCKDMIKNAMSSVDELQKAKITLQKKVMDQQEELLKSKTQQLESVQTTVKTELKSYCDAAKKCLPSPGKVISITAEQVKEAVKSAVEEEDRTKNLIMFGIAEETGEQLEQKITEVLEQVGEKPRIDDCIRIGFPKQGAARPIRVTMFRADTVQRTLSKAGRLMETDEYKTVYLAADRTTEERATRRKLVDQLKLKRESEPELHHFIRNDKIVSRSKPNAK